MDKNKIHFEKFEILSCLKKDAISAVYVANHIHLGKRIFLKTLNKKNLVDSSILHRFRREAKILASLEHPNIIRVWDFGSWGNFFYISFEYFESQNLRQLMKNKKLSIEEKRTVIVQLSKALDAAHQHKIIHRDIKPENILINEQGQLKIADFGLAFVQHDANITAPTSIVGTPAYMSPEQINGEKLTPQSDMFSLGIIIYELFLGSNPFLGKDAGESLNNILQTDMDTILENSQNLPEPFPEILKHLLNRDPSQRYRYVKEILVLLGASQTKARKSGYRNNYAYYIAAVVFLVMLFLLYHFYPQDKNQFDLKESSITEIDKKDTTATTSLINPVITKPELKLRADSTLPKKPIPDMMNNKLLLPGQLYVECQPWAYIYIDSVKQDSTPLAAPLNLLPGQYNLQLVHPDYSVYEQVINIEASESTVIKVNFDRLAGYFFCFVHPWGDIYLDEKFLGQTPLINPLRVSPGNYQLEIKNPQFGVYRQNISIKKSDTLTLHIDLSDIYQTGIGDTM
jgi:serine/threonine-protein kinase